MADPHRALLIAPIGASIVRAATLRQARVRQGQKWVTEFKFRTYAAWEQRSTSDRMIFSDSGSHVGVCKKVARRHWRRRVVSMSANEGSRFWRYHRRRAIWNPSATTN